MSGIVRDRTHDADQRRVLRTAHAGQGQPHSGRPQARRQKRSCVGAIHVSGTVQQIFGIVMPHELILLKNMMQPGYTGSLADYERAGGYQALRKALGKIAPADIIEVVKKSGLRGRGGAGFPTGVKWSFIPKDHRGPRYLICNADESEPGTFKDRQLMERDPHQMIEGMILAAYAISTHVAYIYIRGELVLGAKIVETPPAEASRAGYLRSSIL